jgi:hypothetical protein
MKETLRIGVKEGIMDGNLASTSIRLWSSFPRLSTVFEGFSDVYDYLNADDFPTLVNKHRKETGCTEAEAISETARAYPDIHRKWLCWQNVVTKKV